MTENNRHPFAYTTLAITDKKKRVYHGRTMEFSSDEPTSILAYYPQGHTFQQNAPDGTPGLKYSVKYPFMAITALLNKSESANRIPPAATPVMRF